MRTEDSSCTPARSLAGCAFDPKTLTAQNDSVVLVDRVVTKSATGGVDFSVSRNGSVVYVRGTGKLNALRATLARWQLYNATKKLQTKLAAFSGAARP